MTSDTTHGVILPLVYTRSLESPAPQTRRAGHSAWKHRKLIGTGGRQRRTGLAGEEGVD